MEQNKTIKNKIGKKQKQSKKKQTKLQDLPCLVWFKIQEKNKTKVKNK